jgi:hypothetical protein
MTAASSKTATTAVPNAAPSQNTPSPRGDAVNHAVAGVAALHNLKLDIR